MKFWTIGLPVSLTLALLIIAARQPEPQGFWAPEGYVGQANDLIQSGLLELVCAGQDSIVVSVEEGSPEAEFFASSYLRADVRAFNARPDASRSPFIVEGCQIVGVDPWYHRIDLPFNRLPRWRGDILFRQETPTALLVGGRDQELEIRQARGVEEATRGAAYVPLGRSGARSSAPLLHLERWRAGEVVASAFFVGDDPVLTDRRDPQSGDAVRVNGLAAPPGRTARLESGDWLQVEVGGEGGVSAGGPSYTYLVELGERARTASFVRVESERVERRFPAERLRPFAEPLSRAMDLALQSIPGADDPGSGIAGDPIRLSVEREVHDAAETALLQWCRGNPHPTRPRSASMLIMDAFTGGVRAMPSCPGAGELGPYEPLSARTREQFLRNQNLIPHPVGSAAKPFWAAAVATTFPGFLDLEVAPHPEGRTGSLLGCRLSGPYGDVHGSDDWVGMEEFLQRSCNKYVVEYATAALALGSGTRSGRCRGEPGAGEAADCFPASVSEGGTPVRFCDRIVRLVLTDDLQAVGSRCDNLQLVHSAFRPVTAFDALTNASTYSEPAPGVQREERPGLSGLYRAGRYRLDSWGPVLERIHEAGDTAHLVSTSLRFSAVSPQATNLALNTVEELRSDWVNLLLGGENSRWSNFSLAEAMARMMTGRAVTGRFVDGMGDDGGDPPAFDVLSAEDLHPGVRRRVLHGMELVARLGGTAGRLDGHAARIEALLDRRGGPDYDVFVFAKTGTPAVEKFVSSAEQRLVQRLYAERSIRWRDGRFELSDGVEAAVRSELGPATMRWLREDVLAPIERDPDAFTQLPGQAPPSHPLYLSATGVLRSRELLDRRVDRQGGVLVLGVLAVPHERVVEAMSEERDWISACPIAPELREAILRVPPAELLDPDEAVALTAAVYLDDLAPGQGSGLAVRVADQVLAGLGAYVEAEVERKEDARRGG